MRCYKWLIGASLFLWVAVVVILGIYLPEWSPPTETPTDSYYLQACQSSLDSYRAANKPQRAYSFNPAQPDIDIVYTWVNGSDPDHQRGSFMKLRTLDDSTSRMDINSAEQS